MKNNRLEKFQLTYIHPILILFDTDPPDTYPSNINTPGYCSSNFKSF